MTFDIGSNLFVLGILFIFRQPILFLIGLAVLAVGAYLFYRLAIGRWSDLNQQQKQFVIVGIAALLLIAVLSISV